jgi:hypothetical protein
MRSLVLGALAGIAATMAMTAVMRRTHRHLPALQQYPLPPREIVDRTLGYSSEDAARSQTILSHFGFGALTGVLFTVPFLNRFGGVTYGLGVWAASYLGWIPTFRILAPATLHPAQRNLLMLAAHVVWGFVLAKSLNELNEAEEVFGRAPDERRLAPERQEMEGGG